MADTDEIEIEVDAAPPADTPVDDEVAQPVPKPPAKIVEPEDGVEQLKAKLIAEQAARESAERRARDHEAAVAQARTEAQDRDMQLVESGISQVNQSIEVMEGQIADAYANSDFATVAKLQTEVAKAASRLMTLESGRDQMKAMPKASPVSADPVERVAAALSARSAQWVRNHPQYVTDERLNRRLLAAHNLAETDGHAMDSDEYFSAVERTLGLRDDGQVDQGTEGAARVTQRRQSPPAAAPVSRGANGNGSGATVVRLTAQQREMAGSLFPDLTQVEAEKAYARNMVLLRSEGRLQ